MRSKIKAALLLVCVAALFLTGGCASFSYVSEGFDAVQSNTTLDEAAADIAAIESAIKEAKYMVNQGDDSLYGDNVHTDTVSFKDVVEAKDLDEQIKKKRIDGVTYKLYWDNASHYAFWSTDGVDDIRNTANRISEITHADSTQIKNKTNVTTLK